MLELRNRIRRLLAEDEGQTLSEYAIILAFVAMLLVGALAAFGTALNGLYQHIVDSWPSS